MVKDLRWVATRCLAIVALSMIAMTPLAHTAQAGSVRHPLHTTLAELHYDERGRVVTITVRLFAADLAGALRRRGKTSLPDSPAGAAATLAYLNETFILSSREGRPLPLRLEGIRRTGDLLWVTVSATSMSGLAGLTLRNSVLMDVFSDQVNIVQVADGAARRSLLFTPGAGTKVL